MGYPRLIPRLKVGFPQVKVFLEANTIPINSFGLFARWLNVKNTHSSMERGGIVS